MRDRLDHLKQRAADFWAERSAFIILPIAAVLYCITVYLMLHDVM